MMKYFYIFLLIVTSSVSVLGQTTTTTNSNNVFLDFVTKVYFNPTILLKTQNFKAQNNVQLQILPANSLQDSENLKKFEKAMQKVVRFLIGSGSEGIVRFYFNPNIPSTPFSFVASQELHCKFNAVQIDSITTRLNKPFQTATIDFNNSALFETAIQAGIDYTTICLNKNKGKCGPEPENLITEINTKPLYITVHNTRDSKYDLDTFKYDNYSSYYTQVYDLFKQQNVYVPAKLFIAGGSPEPISIAIHKREATILKQNFKIKYMATDQVMELENNSTVDSLKIKLPRNLPANQIAEFGIYYKSAVDSTEYIVGSFMVHVYTEKTINLTLVSVNNAPINETDILAELKKVYGPVGVKFVINDTENIVSDPSWASSITIESSGLLSRYSEELQDYVGAIRGLDDYSKENYYIILGLNSTTEVTGYMPRKSNIGFVFMTEEGPSKILPHEIAHGAFHLRHIFSEEELGSPALKSTQNLMDYVENPLELFVHQWAGIDDPIFVGWFGGDDEDASMNEGTVYYYNMLVEEYAPSKFKIIRRSFNSIQHYIKNGDENAVAQNVNYVTGVNVYYKIVNGKQVKFKYNHFGKVFYMDETVDCDGKHIAFTDYSSSNDINFYLGGSTASSAKEVFEVRDLYMSGFNAPFHREVRRVEKEKISGNYKLVPLIYHLPNYEGENYVKIYLNDKEVSDQFKEKYEKYENNEISYNEIVLFFKNHPKITYGHCFTNSDKTTQFNKFEWSTPDPIKGPMFAEAASSWQSQNMLPYYVNYQYNAGSVGYESGIQVNYITVLNGKYNREIEVITPNSTDPSTPNAVHKSQGYSNCTHSLTSLNSQVNHLKELLDNSTDIEVIGKYIVNRGSCLLNAIGIKERKALLNRIIVDDGSWVISGQNILAEIIKTTSGQDELLVLQHLKANDFNLLKVLFEQLDEAWDWSDASTDLPVLFEALGDLSNSLNKFKSHFPNSTSSVNKSYTFPSENYPGTSIPMPYTTYNIPYRVVEFPIVIGANENETISLGGIEGISSNYGSFSGLNILTQTNHEPLPLSFSSAGEISVKQYYRLVEYYDGLYFHSAGTPGLEDIPIYEVTPYKLSPYDYVDVIIGKNYGAQGYDKGDIIQVPLMTAYLIQQAIENEKFNQNFRFTVNLVEVVGGAAAIVAAPFTGGGSIPTYIALIATLKGATDMAIQSYQNTLSTAEYNDDFYKTWDKIALCVDVATGVSALPSMVNGLVKIGGKAMRYGKTMVFAISFNRSIRTTKLTTNVSNVYDFERARAISQSFRKGALVDGFGSFVQGAGNLVYKSDFAAHLTDVAGFTQQRGIIGGHNLSNFENYLTINAIEINRLATTNGSTDGLIELSYQIKKADGSGGWKATIFKKTIYDPAKISDAQVIQFGKEAMQEGITSSRTVLQTGSNTIIKGEASNGMKFLGYQNPATGEVLNFHPVINW